MGEYSEKSITGAIVDSFFGKLKENIVSDCIIVGGGPSGLMAARDLALAGKKVLLIERNNYLGGGFWVGGYLMNKFTVVHPAQDILKELGIPFNAYGSGIYTADSVHACAGLITEAAKAGVSFLNMTSVEDVIFRNKRVCGVVINWTPIDYLPRSIAALDPVALESGFIIDATGHDAYVCGKLAERGALKIKGMGAMWVEESEKMVVEYTGEVYPGLIASGMATSTVFGLPRMGPVFSSMLFSGRKAAKLLLEKFDG